MRSLPLVLGVLALASLALATGPVVLAEEEKPADVAEAERAALAEAKSLNSQVVQLWKTGRYREAEPLARKALHLREEVLGPEHTAVAQSLMNLGAQLRGQGRYAEARPLYERSVRIYEAALGPDHASLASALDGLAQLHKAMAAYEEARLLFERAIRIRETALGPDHPHLARSLNNLGLLEMAQGRIREARALFERSLAISKKSLGLEDAAVATTMGNLAVALYALGLYREAVALHERVLAVQERIRGPTHPDVANTLTNLANVLRTLGRYEQARVLYVRAASIWEGRFGAEHVRVATAVGRLSALLRETGQNGQAMRLCRRALAIREKVLGPGHPDVAYSLTQLGRLRSDMGDYDEAKSLLERGLRIREAAYGPTHFQIASSLRSLGRLQAVVGAYDQAGPLYDRALGIYEEELGPAHPSVGTVLSDKALLLLETGRYEEARPLLERALKIHEEALGRDHSDVANVLNNLALVLTYTAQSEQAETLYRRAVGIQERALGTEHWAVATTLTNLGMLLQLTRRDAEALVLFERALRIRERVFGADHQSIANSLGNSAAALLEIGRLGEARKRLERALPIYEGALGPEHSRVASTLNLLAMLLWETEQYEEALRLSRRALGIRLDVLGAQHCNVASSRHNLALLLSSLGRFEEAGDQIEGCLATLEHCLRQNFIGLQTSERLSMARLLRVWVDTSLRLAPHLEQSGYDDVLRFKGLVVRAGAAERRLYRQGGEEVASRTAGLRAAEQRLAQLAQSPPSAFPTERRSERKKAWQEAYAEASAEREAQALALTRTFAPLRTGLERLDIDLDDIQAHLSADAVFVDFLRSGNRYLAWLVRSDGPVQRFEVGSAASVDVAAGLFARLTSDPQTTPTTETWLQAGRALRDLLFAPIEKHLGEAIGTVYVSPDAGLAAVPFAALPGRTAGRFLIDDYLVVLLPMAQDLVPWPGTSRQGKGGLAVGDADYGEATDDSGSAAGLEFVRLPQTRAEADFVKSRLGEACSVLLGTEATEAGVRAEVSGKRVLHLATHGFVRDDLMPGLRRRSRTDEWMGAARERQLAVDYDPMLLAGLAFAGANARDGGGGDDGILTALETSFLDLDGCELVVLSACGTAGGKAESGEGVLGLVQGFQMAGAERVIASLWPVDDAATRILMEHLYDGMLREADPLSHAAALRAAALAVRGATGPDGAPLSAPRNWSGFVCYGR